MTVAGSGVETVGSAGSMNRGPRASEGPEMQLLLHYICTVHTIFHSRRGHLRRQKHQNSWRLGLFTALPRSPSWWGEGSLPLSKTPPQLSALLVSSFGPSGLATEARNLLLNEDPSEPCYVTGCGNGLRHGEGGLNAWKSPSLAIISRNKVV